MAPSRKQHLIDTAVRLFARDGYHATGIDRILEEAGVAKMTLYNHFASKDELILAAIRQRDADFRAEVTGELAQRSQEPAERLVLVFDVLAEWFDTPGFSGCMFINAAAEFADPADPIHEAAAEHKRLFAAYLEEQAAAAGADDPEGLASQLSLLTEGSIAVAHVSKSGRATGDARGVAELLVRQAVGAPVPTTGDAGR